jgi:hypothetical protein
MKIGYIAIQCPKEFIPFFNGGSPEANDYSMDLVSGHDCRPAFQGLKRAVAEAPQEVNHCPTQLECCNTTTLYWVVYWFGLTV